MTNDLGSCVFIFLSSINLYLKAKLAQTRMENATKPQFKSITEFLASLERSQSQNSNEGSCSDTSRWGHSYVSMLPLFKPGGGNTVYFLTTKIF